MAKLDSKKIPIHVAIIMDGNRRWAAKRGLGPVDGHRVAAEKAIEPVIDRAIERGIKYLTFWAFSTENWKRDKKEIQGLIGIFRDVLDQRTDKLRKKGIRLNFLGDITRFPKDIVEKVINGAKKIKVKEKIRVTFALNYGGRAEIIRAVEKIVRDKVPAKKIDEALFDSYLDTKGLPDPDLIIRTGGNFRLSGFLPWQSIYAELYFTSVLWPDFTPRELDQALLSFEGRKRRFGGGKFKGYRGRGAKSFPISDTANKRQ